MDVTPREDPVSIPADGAALHGRLPFRHVPAVFVGNGLEFYDFLTFSYFAVYIARTFVSAEDGAGEGSEQPARPMATADPLHRRRPMADR